MVPHHSVSIAVSPNNLPRRRAIPTPTTGLSESDDGGEQIGRARPRPVLLVVLRSFAPQRGARVQVSPSRAVSRMVSVLSRIYESYTYPSYIYLLSTREVWE